MSEQTAAPRPANGPGQMAPSPITLNLQYTKDLSFEVPGAPQIFINLREAPKVDIALDVQARRLQEGQENFEVTLQIRCEAKIGTETPAFIAELVYCGIFTLNGIAPEMMEPVLLVECPRLLFPFAREIVATATRNGGFPPLLIDPMDFGALYASQRQAQQQTANA